MMYPDYDDPTTARGRRLENRPELHPPQGPGLWLDDMRVYGFLRKSFEADKNLFLQIKAWDAAHGISFRSREGLGLG